MGKTMNRERRTEADELVSEKRFVPGSLLGSFLVLIPFFAFIALTSAASPRLASRFGMGETNLLNVRRFSG